MVKIAVALEEALARRKRDDARAATTPRTVASGTGWSVADVLCTCGPHDRPFEERHAQALVALVVAGAFEYRSSAGRALMTPGAVMLGNAGECFECGHRHRIGDRCIAFRYAPGFFERIAADAGVGRSGASFETVRIAPQRAFAPFVAAACAGVAAQAQLAWDELALSLAVRTLRLAAGMPAQDASAVPPATLARVMQVLQRVDETPEADLGIERLARLAGLSPYHFLRTFERATGSTPHQYVLRARLRAAAQRLADEPAKIVDIALESGFDDVSNFNRAFRAEFGASPRAFRARVRR